jgi:hypothetical protein
MKKLITLVALIAITPLFSFGQNASVSFGSQLAPGGGLFTNVTSVALVDDSFSIIGSSIAVGPDFQGTFGYANSTQVLDDVTFAGTPYLALISGANTAYIQSSFWSSLSSVGAGVPTPTNNFVIASTDSDSTITSLGAEIVITPGSGIAGQGIGIAVVPEPSTYALLAGFAAFLFVAIRRRK